MLALVFFSRREELRWEGRTNSDSTSDTSRMEITTSGITLMNLPMVPITKISGRNAVTEVRMEKVTGTATSLAPSIDACR